MAVLRGSDNPQPGERNVPELVNVVDHQHIRVQVNDPVHAPPQNIAQVISGVVERVLERLPNRRRDEINDGVFPEDVDLEIEGGEGRSDELGQDPRTRRVELGGDEMEEDVLGARSVLENRVYSSYGASEILGVESHGDVDQGWVAGGHHFLVHRNGAVCSVTVIRRLRESRPGGGGEFEGISAVDRPGREGANPDAERREEEGDTEDEQNGGV